MGPGLRLWIARCIIRRTQQLVEHGKAVEIYWVSGHMSVEGNKKADKAAKEAAEKTGIGKCPERLASLAHVSYMISQRKWKESKYWFRMENDRRPSIQRAWYNHTLESHGLDTAVIKEAAYVSRRYFQLK